MVWKEERLRERGDNTSICFTFFHFSLTSSLCQNIFDHKTFVSICMCVCTAHYTHVCLWCECLTIQHRLRSRKAAQFHIPLKNLAFELWGDFNPQNRTLALTHTHNACTHSQSHTCTRQGLMCNCRHSACIYEFD